MYSTLVFDFIDKPGKPDAPEITKINKREVSLAWIPPADDGGADIINYVIQYRVEGGFKWVTSNVDHVSITLYTVTGLSEGTIYEFRLAAENRAGAGPFSEPTSPVEAKELVCKLFFLIFYFQVLYVY